MNSWSWPALLALAIALPSPAPAHTRLERTIPAAGSAVAEAPSHLSLKFSQGIEPAFSQVQVLDPGGKPVATEALKSDPPDPGLLQVSLPRLAPGTYRVRWRVLSVDTHVTEGSYSFEVRP